MGKRRRERGDDEGGQQFNLKVQLRSLRDGWMDADGRHQSILCHCTVCVRHCELRVHPMSDGLITSEGGRDERAAGNKAETSPSDDICD